MKQRIRILLEQVGDMYQASAYDDIGLLLSVMSPNPNDAIALVEQRVEELLEDNDLEWNVVSYQ